MIINFFVVGGRLAELELKLRRAILCRATRRGRTSRAIRGRLSCLRSYLFWVLDLGRFLGGKFEASDGVGFVQNKNSFVFMNF